MTTFRLPDLGEGLTESEIVAWHVAVGDRVSADQPLVSVETDKAVVEIPSPHTGTVTKLHASAGDVVAVGAPLVDLETAAARDVGTVVGELKEAAPPAPKPTAPPSPARPGARAIAAPAVRHLAQIRGVDLAGIAGSGPGGAILSADVEAAATQAETAGEPLRGVRRAMARAMAASGAVVVPATLTDFADIGAWANGQEPTCRLIRAICAAAAVEPSLNATFDGERRQLNPDVDLAIAIDTPDGLFAPVLKAADHQSPDALTANLAKLKAAVGDRSIAREDLRGGTITLSNFGTIGGEHAALVVSPPQVAILGAGRIHDAVLAVDGVPTVRRVLPLSLTFDHRAVTGAEAARFMQAVRADLAAAR
jgi:2-oxoisovalerate dehydrogenase E2 component (dihydrolipoyl transacylase)